MKFVQKLAKSYYRAKFRTLGSVSPRLAAEAAFRLFCTPYSGKPKREMPPVFQQGRALSLRVHHLQINGFEWLPAGVDQPRTILICHGFDSYSYRFEAYVSLFLQQGFRVLAFDAPGHGISGGKYLNILEYKTVIRTIIERFGPVYGIMAHSIGALAVVLTAEELQLPEVKLILVAPASEMARAVTQFSDIFQLNDVFRTAFTQKLEAVAQQPVAWFSVNRAAQAIQNQTLWLHDTEDKVCPFEDTAEIRHHPLPHVEFVETKGLGHSIIYRDATVQKRIIDFTIR